MPADRKTCTNCNGSGQVSFFKGESRFILSWEDCPECAGMGFVIPVEDPPLQDNDEGEARSPSPSKDPLL